MSALQQQIQNDLKTALKNKAEVELATLRLLKSDLQYELTKTGASELDDEAVQTLIKRAVKKRKDAIAEFEKAGRADKAESEAAELAVLEKYLPAAVSEEDIRKKIEEVVAKVKAEGPKDMGKVMGQVMGQVMGAFKGQNIDGKLVNKLVSESLKG